MCHPFSCFRAFVALQNLIFRILNGNYVYLGMHENEEVIHRLYMSLQQLDAEGMLACYHEEAAFRDPVFILKTKKEISAMWTMLCAGARDFALTFEQVRADDETGSAKLEATYQFSQTNRKVLNKINARFRFKEGLIIEHVDSFNFWKWSRQSLGLPGYLLGWSSYLKKEVRQKARKNMKRYEERIESPTSNM